MWLLMGSTAMAQVIVVNPEGAPDLLRPRPVIVEQPVANRLVPDAGGRWTFGDGSSFTFGAGRKLDAHGPVDTWLRRGTVQVMDLDVTLRLEARPFRRRGLLRWTEETLRPWLAAEAPPTSG